MRRPTRGHTFINPHSERYFFSRAISPEGMERSKRRRRRWRRRNAFVAYVRAFIVSLAIFCGQKCSLQSLSLTLSLPLSSGRRRSSYRFSPAIKRDAVAPRRMVEKIGKCLPLLHWHCSELYSASLGHVVAFSYTHEF